jgi:5-methylcytosine-specific restriction enzyme subunit McrC
MEKVYNLFEYKKYFYNSFNNYYIDLKKSFLEKIFNRLWIEKYKFSPIPIDNFTNDHSHIQQFFEITNDFIKPQNWIGTITIHHKNDKLKINLIPKVFFNDKRDYVVDELNNNEINSINAHVIWWMSLHDKPYYSSIVSNMGSISSNLSESIIWMFISHTYETISSNPYNYYSPLEEDLEDVKGKIDFTRYIKNISSSNFQKIACNYDSFQYDNNFNRIIKYVCTELRKFTTNQSVIVKIDEILFLLNEVELVTTSLIDCDKVVLNPIFTDYKIILDNCKLFLSSMTAFNYNSDFTVFALLIQSEKLFENFIYGMFQKNNYDLIKKITKRNPKKLYLATQFPQNIKKFEIRNDIIIHLKNSTYIIFDCKYKLINDIASNDNSLYRKISQQDIYQMVTYSISSGIDNICLLYPKSYNEVINSDNITFEIVDEFTTGKVIKIHIYKIDILNDDLSDIKFSIESTFNKTNSRIKAKLDDITTSISNYETVTSI